MDLVDRYLNAVRFWLPKAQKEDIIAELADDIRAQIEEKEFALGRPMTDADVEALLKQRGRPFAVAGRYLPQRQLVGPTLYPLYILVLKIAAGVYFVPWLLVWGGLVAFVPSYRAAHPDLALFSTLGTAWTQALTVFALVTIGFAVGERLRLRASEERDWSPRSLPAVRDTLKISRASSVAEIVFGLFFLAWWVGTLRLPWAVFSNGKPVTPGPIPIWIEFRAKFDVPVVILILAGLALSAYALVRPYWSRPRLGLHAAIDAAAAAMLFSVLGAHAAELGEAWKTVQHAGGLLQSEKTQIWIVLSVALTMGIVALSCLGGAIHRLVQLLRYDSLRARAPKIARS